jgi:phosphoribosyl 1,2-cyclic phosphate phosphodiesterase
MSITVDEVKNMKLTFLGTGAAEGVPAMFCTCETCRLARKRGEYFTRSQLLIDDTIGVDFPPDAYLHTLAQGEDFTKVCDLLITHSHMDHFYAHDFILRGYKYTQTQMQPLRIYGNAEVKKVYDECTRRELRNEVAASITVTVVQPFTPFSFGAQSAYTATALLAQHSKTETAFVYLVEKENKSYLHLTDTGRLPMETLDYLERRFSNSARKIDFITFDCTFLFHTAGEISRHMGLGDNRAMQEEFARRKIVDGHTKYAITHYSHNSNPCKETLVRAETEYGYIAAYDGFSIDF